MKTKTNKIIVLKPSEVKKTKIVASARRDGKKIDLKINGVKVTSK